MTYKNRLLVFFPVLLLVKVQHCQSKVVALRFDNSINLFLNKVVVINKIKK